MGDAYLEGVGVKQNLGQGLFWLTCTYLHRKKDAEVGNAAVEKLKALINDSVPGGKERINDIMDDIKTNYHQIYQRAGLIHEEV